MLPLESSTISRSATSKTDGGKALLLVGKQNKLDILFPLFDQYITIAKIPSYVFIIVKLYFVLQCILIPLWPMSTCMLRCGLAEDPNFSIVKKVFYFLDYSDYESSIAICSYVNLGLVIVILGAYAFQLWYYTNKRSFMHWSLYGIKIINDILIPCLTMPVAVLTGVSFVVVYENATPVHWFYFITEK